MHVRMFVGRESKVPGGYPREEIFDKIVFTSLDDAGDPARDFAGTSIPAWWSAEMIADQILVALPRVDATADDPEYASRLAALLEASRATGGPTRRGVWRRTVALPPERQRRPLTR